jgi:hypothetical protein
MLQVFSLENRIPANGQSKQRKNKGNFKNIKEINYARFI